MPFELKINLSSSNAESDSHEVSRILHELASYVRGGDDDISKGVLDVNGNCIGRMELLYISDETDCRPEGYDNRSGIPGSIDDILSR